MVWWKVNSQDKFKCTFDFQHFVLYNCLLQMNFVTLSPISNINEVGRIMLFILTALSYIWIVYENDLDLGQVKSSNLLMIYLSVHFEP